MSSVSYLVADRSHLDARALFLAARNAEAVAALGRNQSHKSTLLRARCLLRLGDANGAVDTLRSIGAIEEPLHLAGEYHTVFATALSRSGQPEAHEHYAAAARIAHRATGAMQLELMFYTALDSWTSRDLATARSVTDEALQLDRVPDDRYFRSFAVVRAQLLELSSLIAASREDYALQSRLLLDAWNVLSEAPEQERDVWVQASLLRNFAPLVWDLHLRYEADLLWHVAETVAWTPEVASARCVVHRALAWSAALEGNHIAAFARLRECADLAPSLPWRIATTLDRAFLAAEMRQTVILSEEMLRAGRFARAVQWDAVVGEEASVLLELAEANARDDAALARQWLDRYDRARAFPRYLLLLASDDRRQTAMEQDAAGAVFAAEGRTQEAISARRDALKIWVDLKHDWRAARTAVALAQVSRLPADATVAVHRAKAFRRSWLGRRARAIVSRAKARPRPT
jgi:hypothetical protein